MRKIFRLYRQNIYGIIGTLAFHLILMITFLVAEIRSSSEIKEESVLLDFTTEELDIPEPEVPEIPRPEEKNNQPSDAPDQPRELGSSRAVNEAVSKTQDKFFDDAYQKEIADAQKLVDDVTKTLAQEIPDLGDLNMPEETTDGMKPEEISNVITKGKSNIRYHLENRYHRRLPIPIYLAEGGGEITVDIIVNKSGKVISAIPRRNPNITDPNLPAYAQSAALRTRFNRDSAAPDKQKGTITYVFVPQ